jgi:hypothetical protein
VIASGWRADAILPCLFDAAAGAILFAGDLPKDAQKTMALQRSCCKDPCINPQSLPIYCNNNESILRGH